MSHPACVGYFIEPYKAEMEVQKTPRLSFDKNKCTKREYLEEYVFPLLMPALESVLMEAKRNKCFEVSQHKFDADY